MDSSSSTADAAEQGRAYQPLASGLNFFQRALCAVVATGPVPKHVAFIMDGNRRFARQRGWIVADGHRLGYDKLEEALRWCCELGVVAVTVFAFSIENFKREPEEVDALMALCEEKLRRMCDEEHMVQRRGVRVRVVGDLGRLTPSLRAEMQNVMRLTQDNTQALLNVCFSYTSRDEIVGAVRRLAAACTEGKLQPTDVNEALVEQCLYTAAPGCPPLELLVRTSGERRLSDFMLWQSAKACVAFTHVLWPELSLGRFLLLILQYQLATPHLRAALRPRAAASCGGGLRGPTADSKGAILLLLLLAAAAAAAAAYFAEAAWRTHALAAAAACALGWVAVALLPLPEPAPPPLADDDDAAAAPKPDAGAAPAAQRRVRDYLAQLNVDRFL